MSEEILRKYLQEVLNEDLKLRNIVNGSFLRKRSFLDKLKSLFFGNNVDEVVDQWLASKEDQYEVIFEDDFRREVMNFSKRVYGKALEKSRGNSEIAERLLLRSLDVKYARKMLRIEAEKLKDFDTEE